MAIKTLPLVLCALVVLQNIGAQEVENVIPLTFPEKAEAMGAKCLDGSPPAYQFQKGHLSAKDDWIIYMEGGGWCRDIEECKSHISDHKGSSKHMVKNSGFPDDKNLKFYGILNVNSTLNPTKFRKWNKVVMRYCDGSSFTGDVEQPVDNLYFRGKKIFEVITDELLNKLGLKDAKQVLLTGGSAGGVSVVLHCDRFRNLLPKSTKFKCLTDGGYFIHAKKDPKEVQGFESMFKDIVSLHNSTGMLPHKCIEKMKNKLHLCMFPQYVVKDMATPIFILMSAYDGYQMNVTLINYGSYSAVMDAFLKHNGRLAPATAYQVIKDFRLQFLDALPKKPSIGIFINNCFGHTMLLSFWNTDGFEVNNVMDVRAVSDWFFEGKKVNEIERSDLVKLCDRKKILTV